jgi:hypothetical protein
MSSRTKSCRGAIANVCSGLPQESLVQRYVARTTVVRLAERLKTATSEWKKAGATPWSEATAGSTTEKTAALSTGESSSDTAAAIGLPARSGESSRTAPKKSRTRRWGPAADPGRPRGKGGTSEPLYARLDAII